jgi:Na+/phosphate symporter
MSDKEYGAGKAIREMMMVSRGRAWTGGIVGAILGGVFGWFAFHWLLQYNLYALALPGALIGLGFGFFSKRHMVLGGVFCAIVGLVLMLFCEGVGRPWNTDDSLGYFFQNLHKLTAPTWLFLVLGTGMAFWFGRGR